MSVLIVAIVVAQVITQIKGKTEKSKTTIEADKKLQEKNRIQINLHHPMK